MQISLCFIPLASNVVLAGTPTAAEARATPRTTPRTAHSAIRADFRHNPLSNPIFEASAACVETPRHDGQRECGAGRLAPHRAAVRNGRRGRSSAALCAESGHQRRPLRRRVVLSPRDVRLYGSRTFTHRNRREAARESSRPCSYRLVY